MKNKKMAWINCNGGGEEIPPGGWRKSEEIQPDGERRP